jgi:CheY-like chemotaxis protein
MSESHNRRSAAGDRPQLYVVWEVDDRDPEDTRRTVVTDPKPLAEAEQFAEREAPYFAGRLEVAPARPEDLDDAGEQATLRPGPFNGRPPVNPDPFNARTCALIDDSWGLFAEDARKTAARAGEVDLDDEVAMYRAACQVTRYRLADILTLLAEAAGVVLAASDEAEEATEQARDQALYDVGRMVVELRNDGMDDGTVTDTVLEMVQLRMMATSADPVAALAGEAA